MDSLSAFRMAITWWAIHPRYTDGETVYFYENTGGAPKCSTRFTCSTPSDGSWEKKSIANTNLFRKTFDIGKNAKLFPGCKMEVWSLKLRRFKCVPMLSWKNQAIRNASTAESIPVFKKNLLKPFWTMPVTECSNTFRIPISLSVFLY